MEIASASAAERASSGPIRVLFVCLGNICRSPVAEGVFRAKAEERGLSRHLSIDSAGTGAWHVGEKPDKRMRKASAARGFSLEDLRARKLSDEDLWSFDLLFAMDRSNFDDIRYLDASEKYHSRVKLFREYDPSPDVLDVPDPYYGGARGFDEVIDIVERTCDVILDSLVRDYNLQSTSGTEK